MIGAVFVTDTQVRTGITVPILYALPALLAALYLDRRDLIIVVTACAILAAAELPISSGGVTEASLINRALVVIVVVMIAPLGLRFKEALRRLEVSEKAALLEKERLDRVIDRLPVGVVFAEAPNGQIVMANKKMAEIHRQPVLYSRSIEDYAAWNTLRSSGDPYAPLDLPLARAIAFGETVDREQMRIVRGDGTEAIVLVSSAPIIGPNGEIAGAVAVESDITKEKEAEKKMSRLVRELKRSNAELQQFAYIASHDLQEPLRMVTSFLTLLKNRYGDSLDDQATLYIDYAVNGADKMRSLISDLLTYSRVESRARSFSRVDLNEVFSGVVHQLEPLIEERSAEIIKGPLPTIMADRNQMTALLQNLIVNGIKFNKSYRPKVEVTSERGREEDIVQVRDNGIGISPEYFPKLFQMFERLNPQAEYPGTGIGLAIVKKIVDRHGGRVWVESEEGKGSSFFFSIPREGSVVEENK